jgi:hypothetical protein
LLIETFLLYLPSFGNYQDLIYKQTINYSEGCHYVNTFWDDSSYCERESGYLCFPLDYTQPQTELLGIVEHVEYKHYSVLEIRILVDIKIYL